MKLIRDVNTVCPVCLRRTKGQLLQKDDAVILHRECYRDGESEIVLSHNPQYYAELDRFYFGILKRGRSRGRITNYWVLATYDCQMKCNYCQLKIQEPFFQIMNKRDFDKIIKENKDAKLTLSGGEPTLHPDIFYFLKKCSSKKKICFQLATNGLCIADDIFLQKLQNVGLKEIRISYETLSLLDKNSTLSEFNNYFEKKLRALHNLEISNFDVSLSPTIFKGCNEQLLLESLDYAKKRLFVKEISVNGFSWAGAGLKRDKEEMIMPDEMMDIICQGMQLRDREGIFTFQKALFSLLQLLDIRICMYTQIMIFVRTKDKLQFIVDYFNMKRMKRALRIWEKFADAFFPLPFLTFCLTMAYSFRPKAILLLPDILKMILANIFKIDFSRYPSKLLPVVLNTNCSRLTADEEVSRQCMSAVIYKEGNELKQTFSTHLLTKRLSLNTLPSC